MLNSVKKDILYILANSQKIALQQYINNIKDENEKNDALKLIKALNIKLDKTLKVNR